MSQLPAPAPVSRDPHEPGEIMEIQMGPSHPASHGTIKFNLKLDGETIVEIDVEVGYLHRGFEKMCEQFTWNHCFPYADRLNYASPLLNNVGFALAVEALAGIEAPERCQYIRVIVGELSRICDHMICNGAMSMELGAFTPFLYYSRAREIFWDIFEEETGARVTHSFGRVGGMAQPPTADFKDMVRAGMPRVLAMDYVCGKKVTSVGPLGRMELDGGALAEELTRAYLHQVLVVGFFHADPHPGNVFLTDDRRIALLDLPADLYVPVVGLSQRVATALPAALGAQGTFVAVNNVVSQSIPHLHVHVVPRTKGDGLRGFFWPRTKYADGEIEAYAQLITEALTGVGSQPA